MDFHMMKRKKLQKLCKKHQLPANLTNLAMVHNLTSLLKIEEKGEVMRQPRPCLKNCSSENENKYDAAAVTKKQKKVRFSPENDQVFQLGDKKIQLNLSTQKNKIGSQGITGSDGFDIDQGIIIY